MGATEIVYGCVKTCDTALKVSKRGGTRKGIERRGNPCKLTGDTCGAGGWDVDGPTAIMGESRANVEAGGSVGPPGRSGVGSFIRDNLHARRGDGGLVKFVRAVESLPC